MARTAARPPPEPPTIPHLELAGAAVGLMMKVLASHRFSKEALGAAGSAAALLSRSGWSWERIKAVSSVLRTIRTKQCGIITTRQPRLNVIWPRRPLHPMPDVALKTI